MEVMVEFSLSEKHDYRKEKITIFFMIFCLCGNNICVLEIQAWQISKSQGQKYCTLKRELTKNHLQD